MNINMITGIINALFSCCKKKQENRLKDDKLRTELEKIDITEKEISSLQAIEKVIYKDQTNTGSTNDYKKLLMLIRKNSQAMKNNYVHDRGIYCHKSLENQLIINRIQNLLDRIFSTKCSNNFSLNNNKIYYRRSY